MDLLYRVKTFLAALRDNHYIWPATDTSLSGNRHLHLVDSIHMDNHDMAPLPAKLFKKLSHADAPTVEADVSDDDASFANLPTFAALKERTSPRRLESLRKVTNELGILPSPLSTQSLWQITMILQVTQAQQLGLRAEYETDYQLLKATKQACEPAIELRGAPSQIELLCQSPDNGLALLDDTLTYQHTSARLLQQMVGWWSKTPSRNSELTLSNIFSQLLYDVSMRQHNTA